MTKTMCEKTKKERKIIREKKAVYYCKSCGETSNKEKHLCHPKKV